MIRGLLFLLLALGAPALAQTDPAPVTAQPEDVPETAQGEDARQMAPVQDTAEPQAEVTPESQDGDAPLPDEPAAAPAETDTETDTGSQGEADPQPEPAPEDDPKPEADPEPTAPEQAVGGLSQNRVSITAGFDGSEIFVFGAVMREAPVPTEAGPLDVVITVEGPTLPVVVRRKERVLGIWVNTESANIDEAPSFYAVATTGPLDQILTETERLRHRIGVDKTVRTIGARAQVEDPQSFIDAVVRIRENDALYTRQDDTVDLRQDTLFSTEIVLPANLVEGDYRTRMFLVRDRQVVNVTEQVITVRKDGLERLIYTTAHERPLLYGILSLLVALFAGWAASEAFRFLRR